MAMNLGGENSIRIPLAAALRLPATPRVALVGAGGKTTTLFRLARELTGPVLVTTTTHLSIQQLKLADKYFPVQGAEDIPNSLDVLASGINLFTGAVASSGRTAGLDPYSIERLLHLADQLHLPLLLEADGSRMLPLKAPADHEPAIPSFVDTVLVLAGLSAAGRPLTGEMVHRMDRFAELARVRPGDIITGLALQRVLLHPEGGLKNIPSQARRVAVLNQADSPELLVWAEKLVGKPYTSQDGLLKTYETVLITKQADPLGIYESCAGVILAAGSSSRWREQGHPDPKQLALIDGESLVHRTARLALHAGLDPVIVVTGSDSDQVREAVRGLPVLLVHCPDWDQGMSASLKAGLARIPGKAGSALFLLADQPFLPPDILTDLVAAHARTFSLIAAPRVNGKRANPVLFDRRLFSELMEVSGDAGGRSLFQHVAPHEIAWIDRQDAHAFVDMDTSQDLGRKMGKLLE